MAGNPCWGGTYAVYFIHPPVQLAIALKTEQPNLPATDLHTKTVILQLFPLQIHDIIQRNHNLWRPSVDPLVLVHTERHRTEDEVFLAPQPRVLDGDVAGLDDVCGEGRRDLERGGGGSGDEGGAGGRGGGRVRRARVEVAGGHDAGAGRGVSSWLRCRYGRNGSQEGREV